MILPITYYDANANDLMKTMIFNHSPSIGLPFGWEIVWAFW
jgi:hypothetical protein